MTRLVRIALFTTALTASSFTASAAPITFQFEYTGVNNPATAIGTITMDDALLPNPGTVANVDAATLGITDFSITVTGASSGNGTFGLAHVTNWIWSVSAPINLHIQLVGQPGFADFNWCAANFVGCTPPAPGGISAFHIATNAETGDVLQLTSMTAVPEPATLLLLGAGISAAAARRRSRRS